MNYFYYLLIICFASKIHSQHTKQFQELTKNIYKNYFKIDTSFFSNGNVKKINGLCSYILKGGIIDVECGEIIKFYRNGRKKQHFFTDKFGLYLYGIAFNKKGEISEIWETTEINSELNNPELFFLNLTHIDFKRKIYYYIFSKKLNKYKRNIVDHVFMKNGHMKILRKFFNQDGNIIKIEYL